MYYITYRVQNDIMAKEETEQWLKIYERQTNSCYRKADINPSDTRFSDKQKRTEKESYYLEKFMSCRQRESESVTSFASRLKDIGKKLLKIECTQLDLVIQFKKGVIRDIYKKICLTETDDFDILVQKAKEAEEYLSNDRKETRYRDREIRIITPPKSNVLKENSPRPNRSPIRNTFDCFKYSKDSKKSYFMVNKQLDQTRKRNRRITISTEEVKKALNELEVELDTKQIDWLSKEVIERDNGQHNSTTRNRHLKRLIKAILKS